MSLRLWITNVLFMLASLTLSFSLGWTYLADEYTFNERKNRQELDLKREFDKKQAKASVLESMKQLISELDHNQSFKDEVLSFLISKDNIQLGCIKFTKLELKTESCVVKEKLESEFYHEQLFELKLTGTASELNHFFESVTDVSNLDFKNMSWKSLSIRADSNSTELTVDAIIVYYYLELDDQDA